MIQRRTYDWNKNASRQKTIDAINKFMQMCNWKTEA